MWCNIVTARPCGLPGLAASVWASQDDDDDDDDHDDDDDEEDEKNVFDIFSHLMKTPNDCMINCSTGTGHLIFS